MAAFFILGEKKIRPGVYFRYKDYGQPPIAGVDDGVCAAVFRSNWGPIGKPVLIERFEDISKVYGVDGTIAVPLEQFKGGARSIYCVRLGGSGISGSYDILDTDGTACLRLILKYPGSRQLLITIRPTLDDPSISELLLLDGTMLIERLCFANTSGGVVTAATAMLDAAKNSVYFTLSNLITSIQTIAAVDQAPLTCGIDPTIDVASYSAAFEALEPYQWNVISVDTNDIAVQQMMQMYLNRVLNTGKFVLGVVGESKDVPFEDRLRHASAFNDFQIVYVGNGFVNIDGMVYDGYMAAARIAGLIAGTPSNESITHLSITGAIDLIEQFSGNQYDRAINAGMLTFSTSKLNTIWVDQGINTLVLPGVTGATGSKEDSGWKKIKRVKVRFELMYRLNGSVENIVGRINNDEDGRYNIIQISNTVCNAMVTEKKLLTGAHVDNDNDNKPQGDSAWFTVFADDIDALEKMYFTFMFRFTPEESGAQ